MSSPDDGGAAAIAVFGAAGVVGRRTCAQLAQRGARVIAVTRRPVEQREPTRSIEWRHAEASDPRALAAALAGATVVVDAAGPLRDTAAPVLVAASAVGAHYIDCGGEQAVMQALYERHESMVRRAGLIALPGAGVDCMLGDLAAAWAAAHVCGADDASADDALAVRDRPAPRLAEERPLDEICTSYVFDDLVLSAGSQRALFGAVGARPLVWRRDRWEPGRTGEARRINAGPSLGGERDAIAHAGGDVLAIPRHVAALRVASYVSTTRKPAVTALMRLVASALPLLPRAASEVLAPYRPSDDELARTRFAVVAQVRRGFSAAQVVITGHDLYATTAAILAWTAQRLATRGSGPVGMRAPGELFAPRRALVELADVAALAIEPSFGVDASGDR